MNSTRPMSRRRFLALVGGAGGALGAAGLGGWRLLSSGDGSVSAAGGITVDPDVEIVAVEPGFVDATVWNDDLLTLRAAADGSGIVLRSEADGTERTVDGPDGFTARCVGVIDDTIVIGGHRNVRTGQMAFRADADYEQLLRAAGPQSALLLGQPHRPAAVPHVHVGYERRAVAASTVDLSEWNHNEVKFSDGTNGSIAAILEHSSTAAMDHYSYPEHTDSIYEVVLIGVSSVLSGEPELGGPSQEIDHGAVWGSVGVLPHEIVIVSDRHGIRGFRTTGELEFSIADGSRLLGVRARGNELDVAVSGPNGIRESRLYASGEELDREAASSLTFHQISSRISLAFSDRKLAGVFPNSQL